MTRVLLLGATGTIGRATARALLDAGHEVHALIRPGPAAAALPPGLRQIPGDAVGDPEAAARALAASRATALVSCLASRSGAPADAWAVDHDAHQRALAAAQEAGVEHLVLLSAICVQKPLLAFQKAKLAFESSLQSSGLDWTIVRPTAFFKSLSGQVARVQSGRPFLVFGDGRLTACKPISDRDLGAVLAACLTDPTCRNRILPVGGPGPALTPLDQVAILSDLLGRDVPVRRVPLRLFDTILAGLRLAGTLSPRLAAKADLARIGRYYATESMLVLDPATARYSADATPEYGTDTLRDHYAAMLRGEVADDRGAHAVF